MRTTVVYFNRYNNSKSNPLNRYTILASSLVDLYVKYKPIRLSLNNIASLISYAYAYGGVRAVHTDTWYWRIVLYEKREVVVVEVS